MTFLFLDFDNTLSEQSELHQQYVTELSALLVEGHGGSAEAWQRACATQLLKVQKDYESVFVGNPLAGYRAWLERMRVGFVTEVFAEVGAAMPDNPLEVATDYQFSALTSCNATYPGAYEALETLFREGVRVQLASANDSEFLLAALIGAGIESFTESKFGPDLVDCAKEGPEFYKRIFEASGVLPEKALVLDDHPETLNWARETGARTVQTKLSKVDVYPDDPDALAILRDLKDLPVFVRRFSL